MQAFGGQRRVQGLRDPLRRGRGIETRRPITEVEGEGVALQAGVAHAHREGSAALAQACGRAIAHAALDQFPVEPLRAALAALAREIEAAPRLVVTVAPELVEGLEAILTETAQAVGFAGAIQIRGGPGRARGAFTLDFGDGSAAFDPEAATTRVAAALDAALAAEGLHAEPLVPGADPLPGES